MIEHLSREKRARRAAVRQGLELQKSPRRDRNARDYGKYQLVDEAGAPVMGNEPFPFSASLDEIERRLKLIE